MSKYIGIFVFVFSLFSLGVHAGESFRFRVYLKDKGDSGYTLDNLTYFIGHQANMRIMANIAKQLNLPDEKFLHNIEELGNTGSVSSALVYAQNDKNFKKDDLIAITVFGGGYSTGACLIKH